MKKFIIISRKTLINSPYCPIEKQIVKLPQGKICEWFVNTSNDAIVVIPILKTGEILLQKNYKHGSQEIITEFCAGLVDDNETPKKAVKRELEEETGYISQKIIKLGEVFANPTGSTMKYHFFLAKNCEIIGKLNLDSSEQIETFTVSNIDEAIKILTNPKTKTSTASISALTFIKFFRKI